MKSSMIKKLALFIMVFLLTFRLTIADENEMCVQIESQGTNNSYMFRGDTYTKEEVIGQLKRWALHNTNNCVTLRVEPATSVGIVHALKSEIEKLGYTRIRCVLIQTNGAPYIIMIQPFKPLLEETPQPKQNADKPLVTSHRYIEWEQVLRPSDGHTQIFYNARGMLMILEPTRACVDCGRPLPQNFTERCFWCNQQHPKGL